MRGALEVGLGYARDPFDAFGPVTRDGGAHVVEALRAPCHVLLVDEPVAHDDVQEPVREREIGSRDAREVQRRRACGGCPAWVDDDEGAATRALLLEVLHDRRHRLGNVGSDEEHHVGARDVFDREGDAAIEAERAQRRGRRRGHAVATVVVDGRGPEDGAGQLPEPVRLFVGERSATEHPHRVTPVTFLDGEDAGRDALERFIPGRLDEPAVRIADERAAEALGMIQELSRGVALDAERALVDRKFGIAHDRQAPGRGRDAHPALKRAVRTVAGDRGHGGSLGPLRVSHVSAEYRNSAARHCRGCRGAPAGGT